MRQAAVEALPRYLGQHWRSLALRCLDHVEEVRALAVRAVLEGVARGHVWPGQWEDRLLLGEDMARRAPEVVEAVRRRILADPARSARGVSGESWLRAGVLVDAGVAGPALLQADPRNGRAADWLLDVGASRVGPAEVRAVLEGFDGRCAHHIVWLWSVAWRPGLDADLTPRMQRRLRRSALGRFESIVASGEVWTPQEAEGRLRGALADPRRDFRELAERLLSSGR